MMIYRLIYKLLKLILNTVKSMLSQDLNKWLELRQKNLLSKNSHKNTYWFHAASGEIEYAKTLIRLLKTQNPNINIVVTYSSPSAEKLFANINEFVTEFIALPWDEPAALQDLLTYLNPKILIFSRTDFWPELINQAKQKNIPMAVIAFNPKFNFLNKILYKTLLKNFKFISCLDSAGQLELQRILPNTKITADGDTRFDQVFYRLSQSSKLIFKSTQSYVVFGSTWPQDEEVVVPTFALLKKNNLKIVLSPHDVKPENIQRLKNKLNKFSISLLSDETNLNELNINTDIFIIDRIGYLADAYRNAKWAFVGGSFKDKVHSVMEPLCSGLPVIVGPYYKNNPEALKYLNKYVFSINNTNEFNFAIEQIQNVSPNEILNEMKLNLNASEKVLNLI